MKKENLKKAVEINEEIEKINLIKSICETSSKHNVKIKIEIEMENFRRIITPSDLKLIKSQIVQNELFSNLTECCNDRIKELETEIEKL